MGNANIKTFDEEGTFFSKQSWFIPSSSWIFWNLQAFDLFNK